MLYVKLKEKGILKYRCPALKNVSYKINLYGKVFYFVLIKLRSYNTYNKTIFYQRQNITKLVI